MKLCIPTETDRGIDALAASHFGTAAFFTMVDLATDGVRAVRNPACGHRPGECHHVDILQAHHVQILACSGHGSGEDGQHGHRRHRHQHRHRHGQGAQP